MRGFVLKVVICVLCIYSIISVVVSLSKPNVMDEIGEQKIYGLARMPEIYFSGRDEWDWILGLETMGALSIDYQEEYLREDVTMISLHFYYDTNDYNEINDFSIGMKIVLSESDKVAMGLTADYDYEKKELTYNPIVILQGDPNDPEGIIEEEYIDETIINQYLNRYGLTRKDVQRYQDYVIYEVVVKTWTKAHKESYWLERWKLKRKEIDHTFWFERKYYPPDVL